MTSTVVYFIDDSATMREVIKIAFRRENMEVFAFPDADAAFQQTTQQPPDVVISDVIMPGKDGYEVCQRIKQNPATSSIPVVLMSGVVNKSVAEKAFSVRADELIRKPFQPGDLIERVKQLLIKSGRTESQSYSITQSVQQFAPLPAVEPPRAHAQAAAASASALSSIFAAPAKTNVQGTNGSGAMQKFSATPADVAVGVAVPTPASRIATPPADVAKLRIEILRLEHLVKKLHSELAAECEYAHALEEHIKTLQETD